MTPDATTAEWAGRDGTSTQPAPRRPHVVVILGALSAFGPLSIDMYLPALPTLGLAFQASQWETEATLSACLLGLAFGQTVAGPLSDALGRRRPLLVGLAAYAVASLLCAFAPTVFTLIALRFVQGLAGAAGIVIARAVVRDMHAGVAAAKYFSLLMLVNGLAPILAPIFGAQLLRITTWRGVFVTLAVVGVLLFLAAAIGLRETLPPERRQTGGVRATLQTFRGLLADRAFVGYALSCGLAFAAMFSYISGSPFVLQDIFGLSPQAFSLCFGANALGIMVAGQINRAIVGRIQPARLLAMGLIIGAMGGGALLVVVASGRIGLVGVLPALFLVVASIGFISPNGSALALSGHPRTAGSASALLGVLQYVIGAIAAPMVGIAGATTALPMGMVMAALSGSALAMFVLLARPGPRRAGG